MHEGDDEDVANSADHDDQYSVVEDETEPKKLFEKYDKQSFFNARKRELSGLLNNGTFSPTAINDVPKNSPIFGSNFLEE